MKLVNQYIIVRKKGSSRVQGAIRIKKGITLAKIRKITPSFLKKGLTASVVTEKRLQTIILKQRPRNKKRKTTTKRVTKRKK